MRDNEVITDFDLFSDDSIERQKKMQENLEDSLEVMKYEQSLNKTAFFGVEMKETAEPILEEVNFSFCSDIR